VINGGEILAIVGESGCGKTTLGRLLVNLEEPTEGELILNINNKESKNKTERSIVQIVFQDPYTSLNPRMQIRDLIGGPLKKKGYRGENLRNKILEILSLIGLEEQFLLRYPHELSGGQLQRVNIARALSVEPEFIVLDEPTSNLDVSVQAKILKLLKDLQKKLNLTFLLITHDMGIVYYLADRVAVMYLGKIIEIAEKKELFNNPLHPYTKALLSCVPKVDPVLKIIETAELPKGEVPSSIDPPLGCRFHTRCKDAFKKCGWNPKDLIELLETNLNFSEDEIDYKVNKSNLQIITKSTEINKRILDFIEENKGRYNVLNAIKNIDGENDIININFYKITIPELTSINDKHRVACFLY
jgi:oligopeptide/dipeptide ABC transporter ATP-binding protein